MQEKTKSHSFIFPKTPTGVDGLDEITEGGFPQGRPNFNLRWCGMR
ncbi:hypothetical protein [Flavobacterium ginsengisoli]|nr:hypothetical protein [Flavobacterium ginsengisoli]